LKKTLLDSPYTIWTWPLYMCFWIFTA